MKCFLILFCLASGMLTATAFAAGTDPVSPPSAAAATAISAAPPETTPFATAAPAPAKILPPKKAKKSKTAKNGGKKPAAAKPERLAQANVPATVPATAATGSPPQTITASPAEAIRTTATPPAPPQAPAVTAVTAAPSEPAQAAAAKPAQDTFLIEPLGNEVYAAIAKIGSRASSNTMFVIGRHYVVAVGAHMTKEVIQDLNAEIASRTSKPVRYFVLAHHHPGYSHVDFDFPPDQDVIMAWQAWQQLNDDVRKPDFPIIFFNEGMTIKTGNVTLVLSNLGRGHSAGDVVTFIPETGVIFASDLFYVDSVGYMAGGFMREWVLALEALEQLGAERIIPGTGPVSSIEEVSKFKEFFRDFLTEVIRHIERGDTLEQTLQTFDLPKYRNLSGYQLLMKANLKRAYEELKLEFGR